MVAFSLHEAILDPNYFGVDYFIHRNKYAVLSGDVSEPSDDNGIAVFK